MSNTTNPFGILGLDPETCNADDVRRAHRRLIRLTHPDRNGTHDDAAALNIARDDALSLLAAQAPASQEAPADPVDDGAPEWAASSTSYRERDTPAAADRFGGDRPGPLPVLRALVAWLPLLLATVLALLPQVPPAARLLLLAAFTLRAVNGFLPQGGNRD